MSEQAPVPEEFHRRADTYEGILPIHVDADYYRDGELIHSTRRTQESLPDEEQPGWTVQGGTRGQAA